MPKPENLVVKKFGGTSIATIELIRNAAININAAVKSGQKVVVVMSAMAGETNRLSDLAHAVADEPLLRELDVVLSSGEQVSVALLSIALNALACPAQSFAAWQIPIISDSHAYKARILEIKPKLILECLAQNKVAIVAGFQGLDKYGNTTTLGRGGSDTTAVALAAALKARECQIYTDVAGVYTTDPRVVPYASLMAKVTFEEMLELASLGAKVLQIRSVEMAGMYNVPLRVLSAFSPGQGTLITYEDNVVKFKPAPVTGIALHRDEAKIVLSGMQNTPDLAALILEPIAAAQIDVDMIIQNESSEGLIDFTFTVHRQDFPRAVKLVQNLSQTLSINNIYASDRVAKLSLVGFGMKSSAGVASKMFRALGQEGIQIQLISTSEIKVSVVIDEKYIELGTRALHEAFSLDQQTLLV